jgi:hypothetical protein
MKVIGKHREILTELLIYYLRSDDSMANSFNESIIKSIIKQYSAGDMWIEYYIDDEGPLRMNITNELTT